MAKPATIKAAVAVLFVVLLAAVGLTVWSGSEKTQILGPTHLAQDSEGRVWVIANSTLYLLDAEGALLRRWTRGQLPIPPDWSGLAAYDQGRVLMGSLGSSKVYRVDDQGRVETIIDPAATSAGRFFSVYSLAWDPVSGRILVSDTSNHRLLAFDASGSLLSQAGGSQGGPYNYPNALGMAPDGRLFVANTNHHRVDWLSPALSPGEPLALHDRGRMRCCSWSMAAAVAPGGQRYASFLDNGMSAGQVYQFDSEGVMLYELSLPNPRPWVTSLLARRSDLLLADTSAEGFRIHHFNHTPRLLGEFGDAAFRQQMGQAREQRQSYARLQKLGQGLALLSGVGLLLGALLLRRAEAMAATGGGDDNDAMQRTQAIEPYPPRRFEDGLAANRQALMLGLLFPGLGQFRQRRLTPGIAFLVAGLGFGWNGFMVLYTVLTRTAEVDPKLLYGSLMVVILVWVASLVDTARNAPAADA
ncbi:hypothetical protein D0B54_14015 [Solimonas sp. K1W22B-7]|uniref:hypothetical protein n=1 Tax=Solimonas sp. K1W22B-7 TaxID=2303331 RepID=UPI000E33254F|nr:hypothetical protein [Solimonas sp. K1W22B-7]AXQ29719.1 hypothetical protein D0B54_14015 [Solimonas sp. K1W22B-7]